MGETEALRLVEGEAVGHCEALTDNDPVPVAHSDRLGVPLAVVLGDCDAERDCESVAVAQGVGLVEEEREEVTQVLRDCEEVLQSVAEVDCEGVRLGERDCVLLAHSVAEVH